MISDPERKHLQQCELLIAKEIKRLCEKHAIPYYLVGGSLLGAVRHRGFIPWDDDIDIGMERSDYDRFCGLCAAELGEAFVLQTWDTDENYPMSYGKVRLKGTCVREAFLSGERPKENGIFVDVFPYDNVPDDPLGRLIQEKGYYILKRLLWLKKGHGRTITEESARKKRRYRFAAVAASLISYRAVRKSYDRLIRRYNDRETERLVFDGVYSYEINSIRREWLKKTKMYRFEDTEFMSFEDADSYLRHMFRDYMQLPPEDQRHSHEILAVDFGEYGKERRASD